MTIDTWNTVTDSYLTNGTGSFTLWIPWLYTNAYGKSAQATRESWCPSAMVDSNGDLYTLTFYSFNEQKKGPCFVLRRHTASTSGFTISSGNLYWNFPEPIVRKFGLWKYTFILVYEPPYYNIMRIIAFGDGTNKAYLYRDDFKHSVHNMLSPVIAQEVSDKEPYLYVVMPRAPQFFAYNITNAGITINGSSTIGGSFNNYGLVEFASGNEARKYTDLYLLKIAKTDLGTISTSKSIVGSENNYFGLEYYPVRVNDGYAYQPEWGALDAVVDDSYLYILKLTCSVNSNTYSYTTSETSGNVTTIHRHDEFYDEPYDDQLDCRYYLCEKSTLRYLGETNGYSKLPNHTAFSRRYQRVNNETYFNTPDGTSHYIYKLYNSNNKPYNQSITHQSYSNVADKIGGVRSSCHYPQDFYVFQKDSDKIYCFLGFKSNAGWNKDQAVVGWDDAKFASSLFCAPESSKTTETTKLPFFGTITITSYNWQTFPKNYLYVTDCNSKIEPNNRSGADVNRLYLNTQKFVPYTINGHNYIIYAYCYPGKSKQLYLGFAPYDISKDHYIRLFTGYEFRDKSNASFGSFTSCSRIISMDLKNGHLWITFMNAESTAYSYFHILAKDLVGE